MSVCARHWLFATCVLLSSAAKADVLTFDDLVGTGSVPTNYGGLQFSNWSFSSVIDPAYPTHSGLTNVFTDVGSPSITNGNATIHAATPFVLDGAWFSGFSGVTFQLSLSGALVHVSSTLPDATLPTGYGPAFLSSGYSGLIDTIVVSGVQGFYAMDDLTFHRVAAVPEPETYALLLAGIGLMARVLRSRRSRT